MNLNPLLQIKNLKVVFEGKRSNSHAVRGVSFEVFPGESVGIVGESGCGKTTIVHAITGLIRKAKVTGSVLFEGTDLLADSRKVLGNQIGMVFQDPMTSLNPTMKIRKQIEEGILFHKLAGKYEAYTQALELLKLVDIPDVRTKAEQYPHELSGGQRQRVCIAIALSCNPKLLIADEPTTALDVTTQTQILRLIEQIQKRRKMGFILVTHDLKVVHQTCDRVLVCYAGKIIESGKVDQIFRNPLHPYTRMLLEAKPGIDYPKSSPLKVIEGTSPPLDHEILGCSFSPRCPFAEEICQNEPLLFPFENFHASACWKSSLSKGSYD